MHARLLPALLALVGALLAGNADAQEAQLFNSRGFRIQAGPAYEGAFRSGEGVPLLVRIENTGPDAMGLLRIAVPGEQGGVQYPVSLPRGSKKTLPISDYQPHTGAQLFLDTDRGTVELSVTTNTKQARSSLIAVGDGSGGFAFLDSAESAAPSTPYGAPARSLVAVAYARPEVLPENEVGLDRASCIALLPGSERLNARQIGAIRQYVLRGGHLVLFGGASAPILTDARLADMIPYRSLEPGGVTIGGRSISIQRPEPIPGARLAATSGVPIVRRDYGMGRVSLFAADPTDGPFERVPNRGKIVARALDLQRSAQYAGRALEQGARTVPEGTPAGPAPGEIDPFSLPIPPTSSILLVLGAYFVVVLPVNFLVLRAFRRLELAWFTAPLLAVGFAGLLFRNAGSLYKTGLSHTSQTTVFATSGGREGLALGSAQIFFPGAMRGPIPIPGAEAIGDNLFQASYDSYYYSGRRSNARPLDVIMADGPSVPDYSSTALEFRDLDFRQKLDLGGGIRVIGPRRWRQGGEREVEVVNGSRYSMREVRVAHGPRNDSRILGTDRPIPPGGRAVLREQKRLSIEISTGLLHRDAPMLIATIDGAPVGPQLGKKITSRAWTRIVVSGEVR